MAAAAVAAVATASAVAVRPRISISSLSRDVLGFGWGGRPVNFLPQRLQPKNNICALLAVNEKRVDMTCPPPPSPRGGRLEGSQIFAFFLGGGGKGKKKNPHVIV